MLICIPAPEDATWYLAKIVERKQETRVVADITDINLCGPVCKSTYFGKVHLNHEW